MWKDSAPQQPEHSYASAAPATKYPPRTHTNTHTPYYHPSLPPPSPLSLALLTPPLSFPLPFLPSPPQSSTPSYGLVMAVQPHRVIVACLTEGSSQPSPPSTGSLVHHVRGEVPSFPVGPSILGRTLTPLGHPADDLAPLPLPSSSTSPVPSPSSSSPSSSSSPTLHYLPTLNPLTPSLTHRSSPTHFLSTGFKHLDFFHPLTRGLRIGLLGDKLTGKTTLALDSLIWVIRQSKGGVKGVYVCVGKKRAEVRRVRERLLHAGVLDEVTIVHSSDGDSQASQYLAPFSGCTVADWWRDQGKHCVIVYDDLVTHGAICNGMERSIGYPSLSTSYIHAKLLERTAAITGGGSGHAPLTPTPRAPLHPPLTSPLSPSPPLSAQLFHRHLHPGEPSS